MDNLVAETNTRLLEIVDNLTTIKNEYEEKLDANNKEIESQLEKVEKYKQEFFESKAKIEKMNADIEGFETDYKKLVERFKDDELANILIAANKEISLKIDERKRKIVKDKSAMNELVDKAEQVKGTLVKLTSEKKALELCLNNILDAYEFYSRSLNELVNFSNENKGNLCSYFNSSSTMLRSSIRNVDKEEKKEEAKEFSFQASEVESSEEEKDDDTLLDEEANEDLSNLEPVDLSDMVVDEEEVSDYDNENVIEGDEHKIVIKPENNEEETKKEEKKENKNKNKKEKKNTKSEEEDINIDVNFDDSLEDDDSLYEE